MKRTEPLLSLFFPQKLALPLGKVKEKNHPNSSFSRVNWMFVHVRSNSFLDLIPIDLTPQLFNREYQNVTQFSSISCSNPGVDWYWRWQQTLHCVDTSMASNENSHEIRRFELKPLHCGFFCAAEKEWTSNGRPVPGKFAQGDHSSNYYWTIRTARQSGDFWCDWFVWRRYLSKDDWFCAQSRCCNHEGTL